MNRFNIHFIQSAKAQDGGLIRGRIQIGEFSESFEASLEFWTISDYTSHWLQSVKRLVDGHARSCLITSITNPETANLFTWWPCYRIGDRVTFQNQLLFLNELQEPFDPRSPYEAVGERSTVTDDGLPVSEWSVPVSCLAQFLRQSEDAAAMRAYE